MDGLEKKGLIDAGTRKSRLGNSLVVVVAADSALQIQSASDLTNASVNTNRARRPESRACRDLCQGLADRNNNFGPPSNPRLFPPKTSAPRSRRWSREMSRRALSIKRTRDISKKVKVAYEVPAKDAPDISYPMALVKESKQPDAAKKFLNYLDSKEAGDSLQEIWLHLFTEGMTP